MQWSFYCPAHLLLYLCESSLNCSLCLPSRFWITGVLSVWFVLYNCKMLYTSNLKFLCSTYLTCTPVKGKFFCWGFKWPEPCADCFDFLSSTCLCPATATVLHCCLCKFYGCLHYSLGHNLGICHFCLYFWLFQKYLPVYFSQFYFWHYGKFPALAKITLLVALDLFLFCASMILSVYIQHFYMYRHCVHIWACSFGICILCWLVMYGMLWLLTSVQHIYTCIHWGG